MSAFLTACMVLGVCIATQVTRWQARRRAPPRYLTRHGLAVGWTKERYAVPQADVERLTVDTLSRLLPFYPDAPEALHGCVVVFREPVWTQWMTARRVMGEQDRSFIMVGWRRPLEDSSLAHELVHRVLEVFAGDPPEVAAHELMHELGMF